ncbi:hypothetical protein DXG01_004760 [Tephrocybe rancida]|nr:hypothetical protein DXG01_004760 [Tephrocybe rancida]
MAKMKSRIIEISSSPEPESQQTHKRALHPRAKSKTAQSSQTTSSQDSTVKTIAVIELSDSDDDLPVQARVKPTMNAVAGPSRPKKTQKQTLGNSSSVENIPSQHQTQHRKKPAGVPLFLPSDEENNPPPVLATQRHVVAPAPFPFEAEDVDRDIGLDAPLPPSPPPVPTREATPPPAIDLAVPEPEPEVDLDPKSTITARVLEIIPDVDPDYALAAITNHILEHPEHDTSTVTELILHALFEDAKYPRVEKGKGKRKDTEKDVEEEARKTKKVRIDYADKDRQFRPGAAYQTLALEHLQVSFPYTPKVYLRGVLAQHSGLYAPSHLFLVAQQKERQEGRIKLPYSKRATPYRPKGKGKAIEVNGEDEDLQAERKWLFAHLEGKENDADADVEGGEEEDEEAPESDGECEDGTGIEPGERETDMRTKDKMIQCPETHLFCPTCMLAYASNLLGSHDPNLRCMDQSGCKALFPASQLSRFLPKKLFSLWERVKQKKELELAFSGEGEEGKGGGLEECPFCEWGCVFEKPFEEERLLRCGNLEGCGRVSCRGCKKEVRDVDKIVERIRLMLRSIEMEEDKHLGGRHAVEEAMTFIKESGPMQPGMASGSNDPNAGKCLLWDSVEQRHADEVKAAAERAQAQYRRDNPDVDEAAIKVDLPVAPPPAAAGHMHNMYGGYAAIAAQYQQQLNAAQATLDRVLVTLQRAQDDEQGHRAMMADREKDLRLLQESGRRVPGLRVEYEQQAEQVRADMLQDQQVWYQMRAEVERARRDVAQESARVDQARRRGEIHGAAYGGHGAGEGKGAKEEEMNPIEDVSK